MGFIVTVAHWDNIWKLFMIPLAKLSVANRTQRRILPNVIKGLERTRMAVGVVYFKALSWLFTLFKYVSVNTTNI